MENNLDFSTTCEDKGVIKDVVKKIIIPKVIIPVLLNMAK